MISFGDRVEFAHEYRSCKPKTINIPAEGELFGTVEEQMQRANIDFDEVIKVKAVYEFKKPREGIFLGTIEIHTAIVYLWNDLGYPHGCYGIEKQEFVEVAEVRCEGIKKTYYVPLEHLAKQN